MGISAVDTTQASITEAGRSYRNGNDVLDIHEAK